MKYGKDYKNSALAKYHKLNDGTVGTCEKCGRTTQLTVDHIIPVNILERLDDGYQIAINDEENFAHYCRPCNTMKGGNLDVTNPKTAQLMTKYMKPYLLT